MKNISTEEFAKMILSLRKDVNSMLFRIKILSIEMEAAKQLQESNKEKGDQILKDLEHMSDRHKSLLKDVKSQTYGKN